MRFSGALLKRGHELLQLALLLSLGALGEGLSRVGQAFEGRGQAVDGGDQVVDFLFDHCGYGLDGDKAEEAEEGTTEEEPGHQGSDGPMAEGTRMDGHATVVFAGHKSETDTVFVSCQAASRAREACAL
jgi:hypothetical protein